MNTANKEREKKIELKELVSLKIFGMVPVHSGGAIGPGQMKCSKGFVETLNHDSKLSSLQFLPAALY